MMKLFGRCPQCGMRVRKPGHISEDGECQASNIRTGAAALKRARRHKIHGVRTNIGDPRDSWCKANFPAEHAAYHAASRSRR